MIVKQEILNKLKEFGLNSYESKLWTAILSRGVSTAGELSDISNVPRSRAYDVLESLEKKGFIVVKLGKPIKYLAVPPHEVIERVKKRVKEDAIKKSEVLENLKESNLLKDLNSLHSQGVETLDPIDKSGAFKGRDKMYDHLSSMIKNSKKQVTIMTTASGFSRKINSFKGDLEKAVKRGVNIRFATSGKIDSAKELSKLVKGIDIRLSSKDSRFCSVDGRELVIMLMDDKQIHESYDSGIWISTPYFVSHFDNMFEKEWQSMKKL